MFPHLLCLLVLKWLFACLCIHPDRSSGCLVSVISSRCLAWTVLIGQACTDGGW